MTDDFIFTIINRGMFKFKICNIGVTANIYYGYYILIMKEL